MTQTTQTAVVLHEGSKDYYPVLRWGRAQYRFPKEDCLVLPREAKSVTLEEFTSFMNSGSNPSRSPERWRNFVTQHNYGMYKCKEGKYPFVMFDVQGFPDMKNTVHFLPIEPATKLLPAIYEKVKDDPEANGIKVNSAKSAEAKAKHQARLDELDWKPAYCMSSQNKSGESKPSMPNPLTNSFEVIPIAHWIKWCTTPAKTAKSTKKTTTGSKRKCSPAAQDQELPGGLLVRTDVGFGNLDALYSVPVGSTYTTQLVDGMLNIAVYKNKKAKGDDGADDDAAEDAEDYGEGSDAGNEEGDADE